MPDLIEQLQQREFEKLFQAFVELGGLDTTHVINEDYERAHKATLCRHHSPYMSCPDCHRPLPPYFPSGHQQ